LPLKSSETVFKEKHDVWDPTYAGVDFNSPYLIVNSIASYPPPLYKGEEVQWERYLLLVVHICNCMLIFKTATRKRESTGKGEGKQKG